VDLKTCPWSAAIVAGLVATSSQEVTLAEDLHVKVMSFNIKLSKGQAGQDHWGNRREMVFDVIRRFDGDFLGVQEAWPDQVSDLTDALPAYHAVVRSRNADAGDGEATPLFYRHERWRPDETQQGTFWLSDTPEIAGSRSWWNPLPRIVTWGRFVDRKTGQGAYVFNTHFCHLSELARRRSAALLAERIAARKDSDPVIVTGDFNAGETSRAIRHLKGELPQSPVQLVDTFRTMHPETDQAGTFNGFWNDKTGRKIDYVFALSDVKVLDARILYDNHNGRYPSDHYPVTAELLFSTPPPPANGCPIP